MAPADPLAAALAEYRRRWPDEAGTVALFEQLLAGEPAGTVEADARARLAAAGFEVDYAAVRGPDLADPAPDGPWVALVAARLGGTRLIDNLEFRTP